MAFVTGRDKAILALLEALGVNPRGVRSFVIHGGVDRALTVHVEQFADVADGAKLADAIRRLAAAEGEVGVFEAECLDVYAAAVEPAVVVDAGVERAR